MSASARQAHEAEGRAPRNDPDDGEDETEARQARLGRSPDQQAEIDQEGQHRRQHNGFAGGIAVVAGRARAAKAAIPAETA
jgi:hypothetical protein